jgi:hypothetical protein
VCVISVGLCMLVYIYVGMYVWKYGNDQAITVILVYMYICMHACMEVV